MGDILEQRVAAQPHQGKDTQRQQGYGHDDHFRRHRQVDPHQLRVAHQNKQDTCLHSIAHLQHPAQQLARIGVVRRDGVNVAVLSIISHKQLLVLRGQA